MVMTTPDDNGDDRYKRQAYIENQRATITNLHLKRHSDPDGHASHRPSHHKPIVRHH